MNTPDQVRLDKWLWAARFFKTRALATGAVGGGKVEVNGARAKPGKRIGVGATIDTPRANQANFRSAIVERTPRPR